MAAGQGFEPRIRGPEPRVIPFHHPALAEKIIAREREISGKETKYGIEDQIQIKPNGQLQG